MKKRIAVIIAVVLIAAFAIAIPIFCKDRNPQSYENVVKKIEDAGYDVSKAASDGSFKDAESAISVKMKLDENTTIVVPVIFAKSEAEAKENCEMFDAQGIKLPMYNGKSSHIPTATIPRKL